MRKLPPLYPIEIYDPLRCGGYSEYHPLRPGIGVKFIGARISASCDEYCAKEERDFAYKKQKEISKLGLAPRVGRKIDAKFPNGTMKYGYITEAAIPCQDDTIENFNFFTKMRKDFLISDYKPLNMGKIRGRLVWLDFDKWDWERHETLKRREARK